MSTKKQCMSDTMAPDPYKLLMLYYFFFDFWQFHICMQCIVIIFTPINTLLISFFFPTGPPSTLMLYSFAGFMQVNYCVFIIATAVSYQ